MKLVILHFHLNRGGVTSVVLNHLRALMTEANGLEEVILMHGGRREGLPAKLETQFPSLAIREVILPEMEYDSVRGSIAEELSARLETSLQQCNCTPDKTVLHAHNHSLGKNVAFLSTIQLLAAKGWRWFLHIHDFAEDFRPTNYQHLRRSFSALSDEEFGGQLYPQANQIQYAVLNGRDHQLLHELGVAGDRLHSLPNPVFGFGTLPDHETARAKMNRVLGLSDEVRLLIYPVRGIRRKNLGEMLLWSVLGRGKLITALTLPPANPIELQSYEEWKSCAERLQLPCRWELGTESELSFTENLSAVDQVLTTSVAEGFGMVFLEAWLAGKPLCGRDLPEITSDFKQLGIWYPQLAANLMIPVEFLDIDSVKSDFLDNYQSVLAEFAFPIPDRKTLEIQFEELIAGESIDFARLTRTHQMKLIEKLSAHPEQCELILSLNPSVRSVLEDDPALQETTVRENAETVLTEFSLDKTGQRLRNIYQQLLDSDSSPISRPAHPSAIRDGFLKLSRFQPLRVEP